MSNNRNNENKVNKKSKLKTFLKIIVGTEDIGRFSEIYNKQYKEIYSIIREDSIINNENNANNADGRTHNIELSEEFIKIELEKLKKLCELAIEKKIQEKEESITIKIFNLIKICLLSVGAYLGSVQAINKFINEATQINIIFLIVLIASLVIILCSIYYLIPGLVENLYENNINKLKIKKLVIEDEINKLNSRQS